MAILEQASVANTAGQPLKRYRATVAGSPAKTEVPGTAPQPTDGAVEKKLTIEEIWERGKRLGLSGPNESARIVRKLRDERHSR
jgi:hypothetical protein